MPNKSEYTGGEKESSLVLVRRNPNGILAQNSVLSFPIKVTASTKAFIRAKMDKGLLYLPDSYFDLREHYTKLSKAKEGDTADMEPFMAVHYWLEKMKEDFIALANEDEKYEKFLSVALKGIDDLRDRYDPEANKQMIESKTTMTRDPLGGLYELALSDVTVQTLLLNLDTPKDENYMLYHASNPTLPRDMTLDGFKQTTGTVFCNEEKSKYIHDRVFGLAERVHPEGLKKGAYTGTSNHSLQLNVGGTVLVDKYEKENLIEELDAVCALSSKFSQSIVGLMGASRDQGTFPYYEYMKTGSYDKLGNQDEYYFQTSSRTGHFPFAPDVRKQNGNPLMKEEYKKELYANKVLRNEGKMYHLNLSKPDVIAVEKRDADIPISFEAAKDTIAFQYALTHFAFTHVDEALEMFQDKHQTQQLKHREAMQGVLRAAQFGEKVHVRSYLPRSFAKYTSMLSLFRKNEVTFDKNTGRIDGTVKGITRSLFSLLLNDDKNTSLVQENLESFYKGYLEEGTFSDRQTRTMKENNLPQTQEGFMHYLLAHQSPTWNKQEYTHIRTLLSSIPELWHDAKNYFPEEYEKYTDVHPSERGTLTVKRLYYLGIVSALLKEQLQKEEGFGTFRASTLNNSSLLKVVLEVGR